ncbi:MAG: serine/threonine protein kinase [Acidobacteria bacterium]|nr:serine/threonine protein kinase [Acidobacteriota bacterium]
MGTVYRARDPVLDRQVALKTVKPGLLSKRETFQRFEREARAAARLQHANIVTIYELGEMAGTLYIAMELLEGMDLAQAMVPHDRLSLPQKVRIVVDVCRGLDFAHKRGVVHRDVKPANVRVLLDGAVKLVDFGIARLEDSSMTQTGLILGTPSYIAPEVLKGGRVDHRADIWAVGVVLYEMLAGRLPYEGTTVAALVYKIVHEPPPPLDAARLGLPPSLGNVVERALAKDPAQRYQDMAEMAAELQALLGIAAAAETPLFGRAREQAYQRDVREAQRLFADNDLERALEAARRARALAPGRTEVVQLVEMIETALAEAPTLVTPPRRPAQTLDLDLTPLDSGTHALPPPGTTPAATAPPRRLPTAVLVELRARGASVFRELATFGEPPATSSACLSPVRDLLATSGADGAIRIWDLHNRTRVLTLRSEMHQRSGHDAMATALSFSRDGALMASGHVDGSVHLWNMATGDEVPVKLRHDASVGAVGFSPDAAVLATGGMDATLKLWDVHAAMAGEAVRQLHRQPSPVTALTYAGAGAWIVTGHVNRILRVLDAGSGRLKATLRGPEALVSLLCPAPDERRLVVASHDRTLRVFDLVSQNQLCVMSGHKKPPTSLSFFADGRHLATVAQDNAVQLWDLETRSTLAALWGPAQESFTGVALFGGGDHIAVALSDGRIRLWGPAS